MQMKSRIMSTSGTILDNKSDIEAARYIAELELDILVELAVIQVAIESEF